MNPFTVRQLLECAERELLRRKRDYPAKVKRGRVPYWRANLEIQLMTAIVTKLQKDLEFEELPF
jgi:hypothetical protein